MLIVDSERKSTFKVVSVFFPSFFVWRFFSCVPDVWT